MPYGNVPAGGADHTQEHRDLVTEINDRQGLDNNLTAITLLAPNEGDVLTWASSAWTAAAPTGGGGGTGTTLVDLGVVNAADRISSAATLYTPGAGELVLGLRASDVTFTDSGGVTVSQASGLFISLNTGGISPDPAQDKPTLSGDPIIARAMSTGAWVANTAYSGTLVVESGYLWVADVGGTSGGSLPDFAGNIGGSVVDNDITWLDQGAVPTTGSAHFYALVGTPVAP